MRPRSVTIVGWWILITSLWGVYSSATLPSTLASNPLAMRMALASGIPIELQQIIGVVNGFVLAFCALTILKGYWWSRLFFVGWSFVGFLFGIIQLGLLLALFVFGLTIGVILFFLSRPRANEWFS
jgi:hypothetical protein